MLQLLILLIFVLPIARLTILSSWAAGSAGFRRSRWCAGRRRGGDGIRPASRDGRPPYGVQQQLASGVTPTAEMFDGLLIGLAGVLLLLPGILSDMSGLAAAPAADAEAGAAGLHPLAAARSFACRLWAGRRLTAAAPLLRAMRLSTPRVIETRVMD